MSDEIEKVRFQIPVRADVARAVEKLAADIDRTSAWLAVELIKASIEDRKLFCDWVGLTFIGSAYDRIKKLAGRRAKSAADEPEVRLQLTMPKDVVDRINVFAEQWNQSTNSAAGKLLASGVHNHEIFLDAIVFGKRWTGKRKGGSNRPNSEKLMPCWF